MQTAFVSIIPSENCRHNVLVNWLSSVQKITRLIYSQIKHTNCILCENGKKQLIGILIMYGERRAGGRRKWVRQFLYVFILGAVVENTIWMTHVFSIILRGWKWDTCDEAEKETLRDSETAFV